MKRLIATTIAAMLLLGIASTLRAASPDNSRRFINIDKSFVSPDMHLAGVKGQVKRINHRSSDGSSMNLKFDMGGILTNPSALVGLSGVRFKSRRDADGRLIMLSNRTDSLGHLAITIQWDGQRVKTINHQSEIHSQTTSYFYDIEGRVTRAESTLTAGDYTRRRIVNYTYLEFEPVNFNWTKRSVNVLENIHGADPSVASDSQYTFTETRSYEYFTDRPGPKTLF